MCHVMIMLSQFLGSWWEIDIWVLFTLSLKIVAVVVAVFLFSRVFSRLMRAIRERRRMERRVARQITTFVKYVAYGLGFLMVLAIIGVDIRYIATSLGVIGVAVGFAAKDIIANLLSGIFLIFEKAYQVNDVVKFDDVYG
ncbi:mechanosensitive ion channel, partial [Candidatus Bathyarchaeota archaeon]|nr:mechanosensitive ion channel [Candidatus Bathyarchaeota archaeon]NIU81591.1 mechanosensitive ion channel [Candidatus Bathyarchaeota archaeon]